MRVIFDLDGTLADGAHREHLIENKPKDWDAYFELCGGDAPYGHVVHVLLAMVRIGHDCQIWSGRSEGPDMRWRTDTVNWLLSHTGLRAVPATWERREWNVTAPIPLRMRSHGDFTADDELKRSWLMEARDMGWSPHLVFDDRNRVVEMWRREGVPCFQVRRGDF